MKKVVAILQARMGSSRLPGKTLATILGEPMLALLMKRLLPAQTIHELIVATTSLHQDDPIETVALELNVSCFRGSENDCLDRYYQAALQHEADVVVRLTGDNPFVDAQFVDWSVKEYLSAEPPCDYLDTSKSNSFPVGLSVEIFSFEALETAWREDRQLTWREHVTPFIHQHPDRFRLRHLSSKQAYAPMRWTVDTPEDLTFARTIYEHFGKINFSWQEVVALLQEHPEWLEINRGVTQRELV